MLEILATVFSICLLFTELELLPDSDLVSFKVEFLCCSEREDEAKLFFDSETSSLGTEREDEAKLFFDSETSSL